MRAWVWGSEILWERRCDHQEYFKKSEILGEGFFLFKEQRACYEGAVIL